MCTSCQSRGTQGVSETATAPATSTPPRRDPSANPTQFPLPQQHLLLVFDYIVRVVMKGTVSFPERTHWPALGGCLLAILGYTDGIALIARNMNALQNRMLKFEVLEEQA